MSTDFPEPLPAYPTRGRHSVSGLSSGAFMTVQLHVAHSGSFVGAGVVAGGPYRSAETFRGAAPSAATACILNSLYIAMTPLTEATAPDADTLLAMARDLPETAIDDLGNLAGQRLYLFTGTKDTVVNQHAVRSTRAFYEALGIAGEALRFVDDVPAGHSLVTMNGEDSPLGANQPPYLNRGDFIQSHDILRHIYGDLADPAPRATGRLIAFDQSAFVPGKADPEKVGLSAVGYVYVPSRVLAGEAEALGVHIALHGCKQGFNYVNFVAGRRDSGNQPPYGDRYMTRTGYLEMAEANDLIVLFPQVGGDDDLRIQNPDGCWDWWGYSDSASAKPDYYTRNAPQIGALHGMLSHLAGDRRKTS